MQSNKSKKKNQNLFLKEHGCKNTTANKQCELGLFFLLSQDCILPGLISTHAGEQDSVHILMEVLFFTYPEDCFCFLPSIFVFGFNKKYIVSRPRRSQGLLYKHCCDSLSQSLSHSVTQSSFSSADFTEPWRLPGAFNGF